MNGLRRGRRALLAAMPGLWIGAAGAHGFSAGDIVIDHPYATPTDAGASLLCFRALRNAGQRSERLLGVRSAAAGMVEIHRATRIDGVKQWQRVDALDLPGGIEIRLRHDGDVQLRMLQLPAPLKEGDRFAAMLRFERAGERSVTVWVQRPRSSAAAPGGPTDSDRT